MEWGILFTVISLYSIKFFGFAKEYLKKTEPRGPFQRPTIMAWDNRERLMRMRMRMDLALGDLDDMMGLIPEKVNWKEEGF